MKKLVRNYLSFALAVLLIFSSAYTPGAVYADGSLPDGTYSITTHMKQAYDLNQYSMADGAMEDSGVLEVVGGQWYVTITLKTLYLGEIMGNASEIKYYENGLGSTLHEAQVLNYRTDPAGNTQPKDVKIPLVVGSNGRYLNVFVDAMNSYPDMFLEVTNVPTPPTTYAITATAGDNGTIEPAGVTNVEAGKNQTYTITPNGGYSIQDVVVDGVSQGPVTSYEFEAVDATHEISATFMIYNASYIIIASAGEHGSISPNGDVAVDEGGSQTFTIVADEGYHIKDVIVGDESKGAISSYTFSDVLENQTIRAEFEQDVVTYTLTASAGAHGSISPSGDVTVNEGASQTYTITPDAGYHVKDILIDGQSIGVQNSYTFDNVTAAHTIAVTFEEDIVEYVITTIYTDYGIIEPGLSPSVEAGKDATFTFLPNSNCHVKDVLVDGVSQGAIEEYTFTNVQDHHTLEAFFEQDVFYTITASAGEHGTISPIGETEVKQGASQAYAIAADEGYHVADVLVDGTSVGPQTNYLFEDVKGDHSIEARFDQNDTTRHYTLTASAGEHGTIAPEGDTDVTEGESQLYTITAEVGYRIKDVTVDSQSVKDLLVAGQSQNEKRYTFNAVSSNHTIMASFEVIPATYTLTASAGQNGAIAPAGETVVTEGENQTYTISPDSGYHIKDVLVDGASQGAVSSYTFENVSANHEISAEFEENAADVTTYTLTASAAANGSISPDGVIEVEAGSAKSFTITPNSGYHVKDVLIDGESQGAITSYAFEDIVDNHVIRAEFEKDIVVKEVYTLTASAAANGSITPNGAIEVEEGSAKSFTITPAVGYHIKDVLVDGESKGAVSSYTFENVMANHEISAEFEENAADVTTYTLTASAAEHGTITPSGAVQIAEGESQAFTITADDGYHIKDLLVDGASQGAIDSYTFENVMANHEISAEFEENAADATTYTLTSSAGPNGKIDPLGDSAVNEGESLTYTITPDSGYHIKDVLVDGESQGVIDSYTFEDVMANHEISAEFEKNAADGATYAIKTVIGAHGSIEPAGITTVTAGSDQVYKITADDGYRVANVTVDGVRIGSLDSYTFKNINADHKIIVIFTKQNLALNPDGTAEDQTFMVYTTIKKAYDITEDSMAAPAIKHVGKVEIVDGKWYLTVTYQSIHFMGLLGNAEDIKYYENGLGSTLNNAEVLSYRTDENGDRQVEDVRIPVDPGSGGVFINMYINAMGRRADAYLIFDRDMYESMPEDEEQSENTTQNNEQTPSTELPKQVKSVEEKSKTTPVELTPVPSKWRYSDVSPQRPYYRAVEKLSEQGLFKGTRDKQFEPYQTVNRAVLATLMYRLSGEPTSDAVNTFSDVTADQWYAKAVAWAKQMDIIKGYSEAIFGPDDVLTKEQIIAILYRYQKKNGKASGDLANLSNYVDHEKISPYAKQAISWALGNDMLRLDDYGRLNPQEPVTRAVMAELLENIID